MKTLKLALYNVFRNKRRTLITLLSIVIASCAIIVFGGFITFTFEALREGTIRTQLGHFQIGRIGYFDRGAGGLRPHLLLSNPDEIENEIRSFPHVSGVTQRLVGSGLVSTGRISLSGILVGVSPEKEDGFAFAETIVDGSQLEPGVLGECVIGEGLAKGLDAKVGDTLTVLASTVEGVFNGLDCTLGGVVRTGAKPYDNVYVKMALPDLQRLVDTNGTERVMVLLGDTKNVPKVAPYIQKLADASPAESKLEMRVWEQLADFYNRVVNLYNSIFNFSSAVLAVVVLLSITNTMSMCVFERFREIGTLRAIGETRAGIMRLFLSEGLVIGVLGGIIGIIAGIISAKVINLAGGIDIAPPPGMSSGYTALITPSFIYFVWSFAVSVLASVGASFYPAYKASRLDIVKALQHV